ncbi:MAG: DUF5004 domain-containing protein [Bacteroidota bacterium]
MMKNKFKIACSLVFILFIAQGCSEDEKEIGEPFDKTEGLIATDWEISEVYLIDEGNPAKPEREVSEFYITGDNLLQMSFEADGTFESIQGDGLNFFPSSGNWSFNDLATPTKINFDADGVTFGAPLGGPTRISDLQLILNVQKSCLNENEEKAVLGYRFVFNRKPKID